METPAQGDVILDKYTVERKLGRGGMGVVVAARHRHLGELVALKFITGMCTPEAQERFWREGRAGAQLRGQHIARVYDMGQLPNGAPYMVMEYLRGLDLKTLLNRDGPFPFAGAIRYILQACEALAEAHDAGIVHRDIKPSNLFLWDRPYGDPCIKVLDFGISKHRFHDDETLTLTKGFLGSPQYMAPEQIASPKNVDARADIWSLGVVLYEIITGTSPFQAASIVGIINKVVKDEPTPLRDYGLEVPAAIESVIKRCLKKAADERFQNIEDLAEALRDVHEELTAPGTRRDRPSSTRTPMERSPERGQPVIEQAADEPAAKEVHISQPKDGPEEPRVLPNLVELSTVKMREGVVQPNDSEPEDEPTRAMAPQNNTPPKAAGVEEKGAPRMATQSTPDGTIILPTGPLEWDSADLATRKNIQPLEETAPPSESYTTMQRKLRSSRIVTLAIVMGACTALVLIALVLQNASASDPPSSAMTPFQGGEVSSPEPSAASSAGSAKAEPIEPAPKPPEATVTPSTSVNTEKPPPPTTVTRATADKDKSTVRHTVPSVLPAPTATEKDKPLPQNDKLQPPTKKPRLKRWTSPTDSLKF